MNWGAPFWKFLHALAERVGNSGRLTKLQEADERRWVLVILQLVGVSMPCKICRKHYSEWKLAHPLKTLGLGDFRGNLRRWLYELHENINKRKGAKSPVFEEVEGMYKDVQIRQALAEIPVTGPEMGELRRVAGLLFALWGV